MRSCGQADREDMLEQRRADLRVQANHIIFLEALTIGGSCSSGCGWAAKFAFNSLQNARIHGLDPKGVANMSIAGTIERLENMGDPTEPSPSAYGICPNSRWHQTSTSFRSSRRYKAQVTNFWLKTLLLLSPYELRCG